ncbi:hypothetical protein B0H19DRAFT_1055300 [Mycena capillaripes]|nr:hypothetical protein B0H19DRAFT_1055300 [Mycena capillaripes]
MLRLPEILSGVDDHELQGKFIMGAFEAREFYMLPSPELAIEEATEHFRVIQDRDAEVRLLSEIGAYYQDCARDLKKTENFYRRALSVATQCNNEIIQIRPLGGLALTEWNRGNYLRALQLAQEAYRIGRASGNIRGELNGIRFQALCYSSMGDFKQCMKCLEEGKELVVQAGLQGGQVESMLMNIEADVYQLKTEYSNARCIQEAILHKTSAELSPIKHAHALVNIAIIDTVTGTSADVVFHKLDGAMTAFRNGNYPRGVSVCEHCHADLLLREGNAMGAGFEYRRLFELATRDSDDELMCLCLAKLGDRTKPVHADAESARWAFVFLAFAFRPQCRSALILCQALRIHLSIPNQRAKHWMLSKSDERRPSADRTLRNITGASMMHLAHSMIKENQTAFYLTHKDTGSETACLSHSDAQSTYRSSGILA